MDSENTIQEQLTDLQHRVDALEQGSASRRALLERDAEIRRAYDAGATAAELASQYHLAGSTVLAAVRRAGGTPRPGGRRKPEAGGPRVAPESLKGAIYAQELADGLIRKEVAARYGVTPQAVSKGVKVYRRALASQAVQPGPIPAEGARAA